MKMFGTMYKGSIFNVSFPFTDLKGEKHRPVLVLSEPDAYEDVEVAYITSKKKKRENSIDIMDIPEGILPLPSMLHLNKKFRLNTIVLTRCLGSVDEKFMSNVLRAITLYDTQNYFNEKFKDKNIFIPGKSRVNYAGRVFDENELTNLVDASLDFWLTEGRYSELFSEKIAEFLGVEFVHLTNSGSSANLLAFSALTSEKLGDKQLKPGDEVISVAAGFPATVTPIIQYGLIPVFVDVDIPTYNIDVEMLKKAISPKTRCIFIAHTLGNPFNIDDVMKVAEDNHLWVIEDNCDAFGSKYNGKYTGTFGHLSTISFYPAHHITTGEGGAIITNDPKLANIVRAFRDWGRDCYCAGGENNTCGKRFTQKFGNLPVGYDHKYVYSEIGYNLKMTDMQAAIGAAQMDKLPEFCEKRKQNFKKHYAIFAKYSQYFILPEATVNSDPAWFSFIVTVKEDAPFKRDVLTKFFNENLIETRNLFAGNITKQPGFVTKNFRIADHLKNTDLIMNNTFFLGTYPGLSDDMFTYIDSVLLKFISQLL